MNEAITPNEAPEDPNPNIKKEREAIPINVSYTPETELDRVRDTVARRDFFVEHGYQVRLPGDITLDNFESFSDSEMMDKVAAEMDEEKAQKCSEEVLTGWREHQKELQEFFLTLPGRLPDKYDLVLTRYGTGGSYWAPGTVIVNLESVSKPFQTFVHEAIHILIEESIVKKYELTHAEKESLVDYLMMNAPAVPKACKREKYQRFGAPSEELLERVGLKVSETSDVEEDSLTPEDLLDKYNGEVAEFFGVEKVGVGVRLYDSWEELAKAWGKKDAPDWLVGFARDRVVHALKPEVMPPRGGGTGKDRFKKLLKHEATHFYVESLNPKTPDWLNEGTSLWVADQGRYKGPEITIDILEKFHWTGDGGKYAVGSTMVKRIMDEYGKEKLFELIRMNDKNERYKELKRMFEWLK